MSSPIPRQRLYASLLILGACILIYSTIRLIIEGSLGILVPWVSVLIIAELLIDLTCLVWSIKWYKSNDESQASIPLRFGAAAAFLHAIRVLIFVIGRIGPWIDFDVRPDHRALHAARWSWGWLYFAAIMALLGVIGVIIIWIFRRRAKKDPRPDIQESDRELK